MKKRFYSSLFFCFLLSAVYLWLPQHVYADPPQDVALNYNLQTQTLTVTITHKSSFTGFHYIKQVEIKKNNELVSKNDYTSQTSETTFAYTYNVQAAENSILEVTAMCSIRGKKTATLTVK
jgi:desulfoferrodoxin (superoxide reductase-like protein)